MAATGIITKTEAIYQEAGTERAQIEQTRIERNLLCEPSAGQT